MDKRVQLAAETGAGPNVIDFAVTSVWNGGWASRDQEAVRRHAAELAAHGIQPPTITPIWFPLSDYLVTTGERIQVTTADTSGEIEYALLFASGAVLVTVASDHTDRGFERHGVQASKQLCPNVIATQVWPLEECEDHWDELVLRCHVTADGTRRLYQEARLAELISARGWIEVLEREGIREDGLVFLSGTPATIGGLVCGDSYDLELADPVRARALRHSYRVDVLGAGHQ